MGNPSALDAVTCPARAARNEIPDPDLCPAPHPLKTPPYQVQAIPLAPPSLSQPNPPTSRNAGFPISARLISHAGQMGDGLGSLVGVTLVHIYRPRKAPKCTVGDCFLWMIRPFELACHRRPGQCDTDGRFVPAWVEVRVHTPRTNGACSHRVSACAGCVRTGLIRARGMRTHPPLRARTGRERHTAPCPHPTPSAAVLRGSARGRRQVWSNLVVHRIFKPPCRSSPRTRRRERASVGGTRVVVVISECANLAVGQLTNLHGSVCHMVGKMGRWTHSPAGRVNPRHREKARMPRHRERTGNKKSATDSFPLTSSVMLLRELRYGGHEVHSCATGVCDSASESKPAI
jgi:hypothetical protein